MDALVEAAKARRRPRYVAIFLILRYTGMRRESVATLHVHHLETAEAIRCSRNLRKVLKHGAKNANKNNLVAPTGFEPVFGCCRAFASVITQLERV